MKSKSVKVWDSTKEDIIAIGEKKIWKQPVVIDQAVKLLKKNLGIK